MEHFTMGKYIGECIRQTRKLKGFTQEELAHASGLSVMSIRRYEGGERFPSEETLNRIASALQVPISRFIGFFKDNSIQITMSDTSKEVDPLVESQNGGRIKLVTLFGKLNSVGQTEALKRIQELTVLPRYQRKPPVEDAIPVEDEEEE